MNVQFNFSMVSYSLVRIKSSVIILSLFHAHISQFDIQFYVLYSIIQPSFYGLPYIINSDLEYWRTTSQPISQ